MAGFEVATEARDKPHDLHDFTRELTDDMAADYRRIQARATKNPSLAGTQGEENWKALFEQWLPRKYQIKLKGEIIGPQGTTSRELDVIVLSDVYPKRLLDQKQYLAGGVVAVFECKTTLKAIHINEAVEHCVEIKHLFPNRYGTPYRELHAPIVFGLLAHSHVWKGKKSSPEKNIESELWKADTAKVQHPRLGLDVLCVADLGTWVSNKIVFLPPRMGAPESQSEFDSMLKAHAVNGSARTGYTGHTRTPRQHQHFRPIGALIGSLCQKLAWEDRSIRNLASYYRRVNIQGSGGGHLRRWPTSIYSDEIRARIEAGQASHDEWNEWNFYF